jgi:hypothetical protein
MAVGVFALAPELFILGGVGALAGTILQLEAPVHILKAGKLLRKQKKDKV